MRVWPLLGLFRSPTGLGRRQDRSWRRPGQTRPESTSLSRRISPRLYLRVLVQMLPARVVPVNPHAQPRTSSGARALLQWPMRAHAFFSRNAHYALSKYFLVAARRVEGALSHGRTAPALYTRRFFYGLSSRQQKRGPRRRQGSAPAVVFATDGGSGRAADSKKCRDGQTVGRLPRLRARTARRSARGDPRTATRAGGQRLGGRRCR